ncbi:fimbrial protein [Salmonella enterica subsp. enterica serovar Newport]|nr:fimbrial protein [Salmonella enterica subsp. enterica serovar Newport]
MRRCTDTFLPPVRWRGLPSRIVPALTILTTLAAASPAHALESDIGSCGSANNPNDSGPTILLTIPSSINMKQNDSTGSVYTSPDIPIKFRCRIRGSYPQQPALVREAAFGSVYDALKEAGLTIQMVVNGQDWTPDTSGGGELFPLGDTYVSDTGTRQFTLGFRLLRTSEGSLPPTTFNPGVLFRIWPMNANIGQPNFAGPGIQFNPFTVQVIPECIGNVSITPSQIDFGHVMTDYLSQTLPRTRPFTVRAATNSGESCRGGELFSLTLNSVFTADGTPKNGTNDALLLSNGQEENGLQLSLKDNQTNSKVIFGTPSAFGAVGPGATNVVSREYTATLEQTPGASLKTGPFSANVTVTVTYN